MPRLSTRMRQSMLTATGCQISTWADEVERLESVVDDTRQAEKDYPRDTGYLEAANALNAIRAQAYQEGFAEGVASLCNTVPTSRFVSLGGLDPWRVTALGRMQLVVDSGLFRLSDVEGYPLGGRMAGLTLEIWAE